MCSSCCPSSLSFPLGKQASLTWVCPQLTSASHVTCSPIQANLNPKPLSEDSQKSLPCAAEQPKAAPGGVVGPTMDEEPPMCDITSLQMDNWYFQEAILGSGRRKTNHSLPLSGLRAVSVDAHKEHSCTQVNCSPEVAGTKLYNKPHPHATLYNSVI